MRRRIDSRKNINVTLLAIECDEFAHRSYDEQDEKSRYHVIMMKHGGKMVFIRFNPDLKGTSLEFKLSSLIQEMHKQIARTERGENSELLEVIYLLYPQQKVILGLPLESQPGARRYDALFQDSGSNSHV
jgi:hypothetical protein